MNKNWRASTRAFFRRFGQRTLTTILPSSFLQKVSAEVELPGHYSKLPFCTFVPFMITSLLWRNRQPSTRRLAGLSRNEIIQRCTACQPVSHQAIADRLRSISLEGLRTVLDYVTDSVRYFLGNAHKKIAVLKVMDCTTIEGSTLFFPWAAPNGDKNAIRLALSIDTQSDCPEIVQSASITTSDNTVFPQLVDQLQPHETGVFDAGFTKLEEFQRIQDKTAYWVAHMASIYHVEVISRFSLPKVGECHFKEWELLKDERIAVGTPDSGGPVQARWCHWLNQKTGDLRIVWTNHFDWKPKRVFQADRHRWRIEVQFRWLKSDLGLDHLPSTTPHGVEAFFLLLILAWLVLRLFMARRTFQAWERFSARDSLQDFQNVLIHDIVAQLVPLNNGQ